MPRDRVRPTCRTMLVLTLTLLIALQATPAFAWGRLGHRVIAKLAERHLTDRAKAEIKALLEPGESLADASTWADEVRGRMRKSAPWHYVDVLLYIRSSRHAETHRGEEHRWRRLLHRSGPDRVGALADSDPESNAVIMVATGHKVTTQEVPALVLDSIIKAMRA